MRWPRAVAPREPCPQPLPICGWREGEDGGRVPSRSAGVMHDAACGSRRAHFRYFAGRRIVASDPPNLSGGKTALVQAYGSRAGHRPKVCAGFQAPQPCIIPPTREANPDVVVHVIGLIPVAIGRTCVLRIVVPRATTQHTHSVMPHRPSPTPSIDQMEAGVGTALDDVAAVLRRHACNRLPTSMRHWLAYSYCLGAMSDSFSHKRR